MSQWKTGQLVATLISNRQSNILRWQRQLDYGECNIQLDWFFLEQWYIENFFNKGTMMTMASRLFIHFTIHRHRMMKWQILIKWEGVTFDVNTNKLYFFPSLMIGIILFLENTDDPYSIVSSPSGTYPPLPPLKDCDFSLLREEVSLTG